VKRKVYLFLAVLFISSGLRDGDSLNNKTGTGRSIASVVITNEKTLKSTKKDNLSDLRQEVIFEKAVKDYKEQ
jgi:hypothetical protein